MKFLESVRIGWRSITSHKLRSTLTLLGVIIGIASVIVFMILGGAFQEDILGEIDAENEPVMQVQTQAPVQGLGFQISDSPIYTEHDVEQIEEIDGVQFVAPETSIDTLQITYDNETIPGGTTGVTGTTPQRFERRGFYRLVEGETFDGPDEAVITTGFQERFEENVSVGDEVSLTLEGGRRTTVTVSGVVRNLVSQTDPPNVFVSIDEYYNGSLTTPRGTTEQAYPRLVVRAANVEEVDTVKQSVRNYLDGDSDANGLKSDDHRIVVQTVEDAIDQFTSILDQITVFIGGIAAISLVVGSIGIANIMIVSVTERTREIGIMKAVGAKSRDILQLFLLESIILGAIGAIFGVLAGVGVGYLAVGYFGWPMVYPLDWIAIAVAVGIAVGIVSGLYPAWRAARVDPIEALRRE